MAEQFNITVSLDAQQLALLEEARGSIDAPTFAREGVLWYAEQIKRLRAQVVTAPEISLYDIDDLTPEDHIRLADEGEKDYVDMDEVLTWLDNKRSQLRAEIEAGK